ncbi:hypothetical protein R1flu_011701 [Riccia fluitans]|uniref:Uncharacterized protein n=1 Tax=Riccia fluitans TaxID=41844 RepID=A0ABD1Z8I6_9MARC
MGNLVPARSGHSVYNEFRRFASLVDCSSASVFSRSPCKFSLLSAACVIFSVLVWLVGFANAGTLGVPIDIGPWFPVSGLPRPATHHSWLAAPWSCSCHINLGLGAGCSTNDYSRWHVLSPRPTSSSFLLVRRLAWSFARVAVCPACPIGTFCFKYP